MDYTLQGRRLVYVDEQALSGKLRDTLTRRREAGLPAVYQGGAHARAVHPGPVVAAAVVVPLLIAGVFGWAWYGWLLAAAALVPLAGYAARLLSTPDPLVLTARDREQIAAATHFLLLPVPDADSRLPEPAVGHFPVAELIAGAIALRDRISRSPAWQSSYLDTHRVLFNPDTELDRVIQHALQLHCAAEQLNSAPRGSGRDPLAALWGSLAARVASVTDYSRHLRELELELAGVESARRAMDLDHNMAQLLANSAEDEQSAATLHDLQDSTLILHELLTTLNSDLNALVVHDV
ncbi:MAG: hypothetical protein HOQ24_09535 [Mycobacteriaceae bacterium]|nr:hypothetical protein [Mycobacteriaceae bacterium]